MLHAVVLAEPRSEKSIDLVRLMNKCFTLAPKHDVMEFRLHHLFDAFDEEADRLIADFRGGDVSGLFFISKGEDLWKPSFDGFMLRLLQEHPPIRLNGVVAGVLVDRDGTYNILTLAKEATEKLQKLGAEVLKPALSAEDGAVIVGKMLEAKAKAA